MTVLLGGHRSANPLSPATPVPTGGDQLAEIVTAFSQGDRIITFTAGDYYIEYPFARPADYAVSAINADNIIVNATDARVILRWKPANILGSLGNIFRFSNCNGLKIDGLTVAYDPPLFTQGKVTHAEPLAGDRTFFRFRPDAGFAFAWRSADLIGSYDPVTGQFQEISYEAAFSDEEPFDYAIAPYPPGATDPVEFTFSVPAAGGHHIPDWIRTDEQIWVAVRKRVSSPFTFVRGTGVEIDVRLEGAAAVGIVGNELIDPTINYFSQSPVIMGRGSGIISGAAGGVVLLDVRGTYTSHRHVSYGLGDDNLNIRTRLWDKRIEGVQKGANSFIMLRCRRRAFTRPSNEPAVPDPNDLVEFWRPDGTYWGSIEVLNAVTDDPESGDTQLFKVTFKSPLPTLYEHSTDDDDRWLTLNRSRVPALRLGLVKSVGGIRTLFPNSHDWTVDELHSENVRSTGLRHSFPASGAHPDYGGARGGGTIALMRVINAVYRYTPDGNAVINVRRCRSDGDLPYTGPMAPFTPARIDRLEVDRCGFGVSYLSGLDLEIGTRVLRDTGLRRADPDPPLNPDDPGAVDDYVRYGRLSVEQDAFYRPYRSFEGANGVINGTYVLTTDTGFSANPRKTAASIVIDVAFTTERKIDLIADSGIALIGDRFIIDYVRSAAADKIARVRNKNGMTLTNIYGIPPLGWARFMFDGTKWVMEDSGSLIAGP